MFGQLLRVVVFWRRLLAQWWCGFAAGFRQLRCVRMKHVKGLQSIVWDAWVCITQHVCQSLRMLHVSWLQRAQV